MLPVPEGLEGERVDAALARLFGVSRTRAAELAATGHVQVNGVLVGKSDRVRAGDVLDVELVTGAERPEPSIVPTPVPGMGIVYDDTEIVVVDKPAGVAAHPSVGWTGPDAVSYTHLDVYKRQAPGSARPRPRPSNGCLLYTSRCV